MVRLILTDEQWSRIEPHCLGKPGEPGRNGTDNRIFMKLSHWILPSLSIRPINEKPVMDLLYCGDNNEGGENWAKYAWLRYASHSSARKEPPEHNPSGVHLKPCHERF